MSAPETSGEPSVAPAETVSASPQSATPAENNSPVVPAFAFGTTRGSGLARGKRGSVAAPVTANNNPAAAAGDYQPTAIQVVTTEREYKNPFAPEQPPTPVAPIEKIAPAATAAPAPVPSYVAPVLEQQNRAIPVEQRVPEASANEPKAELKILPTEQQVRPSQSWENGPPSESVSSQPRPQGRREERGTFRPERREGNPGAAPEARREDGNTAEFRRDPREAREPRQPRDPRDQRQPRDPRDEREPRQPRDPRESREPREPRERRPFENRPAPTPPVAKKKGIFAWLKNLFSGAPEKTTPTPEITRDENFDRRRNHRGGRGRSNYRGPDNRGPRQEGQGGEGPGFNQGERRPEGGDNFRRRHRGGRGRGGYRGDNRGGESRGEGSGDRP